MDALSPWRSALIAVLLLLARPVFGVQEPDLPASAPSEGATTRPETQASTPPGETPNESGRDRRGEGRDGGAPARPRRGIKVSDSLVISNCAQCHKVNDDGFMSRISYMRKSPEGWEMSVKRMVRHHQVPLTADEAKQIVRYLANDHGLTREEAERGLYESERRVHWSDAGIDADLKATCAACHTLGRVHSEQRDAEEWKLLKATHLAFFPLAESQAFRGGGRGGPGGGMGDIDFSSLSESEIEEAMERRREQQRAQGDRADKVLAQLAKDQPLFSEAWDKWQVNRRIVPLEGVWTVDGHEIGRGQFLGTVKLRRTAQDEYESEWTIRYDDGRTVRRTGKGILYAGYSWRGRSQTASGNDAGDTSEFKEVLLLNDSWTEFRGRIFQGAYAELGSNITLTRRSGATILAATRGGALMIPSSGNIVEVHGDAFPETLSAEEFSLGRGCIVTRAERISSELVRLSVDVDRHAERGPRQLTYRAVLGPMDVVLYDTIDYIKVFPEQGLSRVGGVKQPRQLENFECWAMNRGLDDEPRTADDYRVKLVPVEWKLEEFPVRENDDDVLYVGTLDTASGRFTPAVDGPNPQRRYQANNVGEVYVTATCTLTVRKMPERKKKPTSRPASRPATESAPAADTRPESRNVESTPASRESEESRPVGETKPAEEAPIVMETKTFRSRGRLLVTVPLYVRWDVLEWENE